MLKHSFLVLAQAHTAKIHTLAHKQSGHDVPTLTDHLTTDSLTADIAVGPVSPKTHNTEAHYTCTSPEKKGIMIADIFCIKMSFCFSNSCNAIHFLQVELS